MSPLDRKLLRDLVRMKGQAAAISVVIGLGVMMQVMMGGLVNTLDETRATYYDRYRLADVFAPVVRAPNHMLARIAEIPGVASVEARVTGSALVDLDEGALPVRAQVVSIPDTGAPRLNDFYLVQGRVPSPGHGDEIMLLAGFAKARDLVPGDRIDATMNGSRRLFRIVGLVESPEFLYTTAPGELVPDDARFAVIWMRRAALSAAYDMTGAFNEALVGLSRGASADGVKAALDRLLDGYGAAGAYGLDMQMSNRFVSEEIKGLRVTSAVVPPIFLAVAAFLLYIVISRTVQAEREQIGLLKAFGYSGTEVGLHYLKFVVVIALVGACLGAVGGIVSGRAISVFYQSYFKFPFLVFQLDKSSFAIGFLVSILAASGGSLFVLRGVFGMSPAVAMRPPAPADYSGTRQIAGWAGRWLDQPSRMVLRRIMRHPGRMVGSITGISAGMALSVTTLMMMAGFERAVDLTFNEMDRSDVSVTFVTPMAPRAVHALARQPGVLRVEPVRVVPATLRNGLNTYNGAVEGRVERPRLNRVLGPGLRPVAMRREGIILAEPLADILNLTVGDSLTIEVREGRRPVVEVPVIGIAQTLLGASTFMEIEALNRVLNEPGRISGAYLSIDQNKIDALVAAIKSMPSVAGVAQKEDARRALVDLMNTGPGAMRYIMTVVAAIIVFGIVYNAARIAMAERMRELTSLRVLGFTRDEAGFVLLGELAVVTMAAIPIGLVLGYYMTFAMVAGFSTDIYQIPVVFSPQACGAAIIAVVAAALISGWFVKRDMDLLDLVAALKTKE